MMAKLKGKGVVMTALVAGAASFLSKKKNRDYTVKFLKDMKAQFFGSHTNNKYNSLKEIAETAAGPTSTKIRENNFISEGGGQTALAYYNESDQKQVH
ncbi:hypothetical protein BJ095_1083 [Ureibacillus chungkukjangi]|uniref:Uncharacterized protein n=2 Tax=Ureibacillus chungkukjangi TaxID=1202712 RepID=A0A318TNZ5_9BACL|nr:hypothetical protein BJ095_1083 [Ureibacillus chungkukjangi]